MAMTRTTRHSTRRALAERRHKQLSVQESAQKAEHGAQAQGTTAQNRRGTPSYSGSATTAAAVAKQAHIAATATEPDLHTTRHQRRNSARMKRPLDLINPNPDPSKVKRSRIAVEIKSLAKIGPPSPLRSIVVRPPPPAPAVDVTLQQNKPPLSLPPPTTISTAAVPVPQLNTAQIPLTSHQKKVINGIRHELDRLHPSAADAGQVKEPGRKLRSQEATRFKSELSAYFPDYDEVIGNDAKEHHTLHVETPILIIDSVASPHHNGRNLQPQKATALQHKPLSKAHANQPKRHISWRSCTENYAVKSYSDELFTDLYEAQRVDLPVLESKYKDADSLPDSLYETAHRRAERLEKSIRNTEKGRAQHEKDQIIRILGELQGPDWLRTMGVNGVTESKKKTFESARNHFIRGCQAILDKFRWWTLEEKKRKLERDRALAEEAASEDEDEIADSEEDEEMFDVAPGDANAADDSDGDPPDASDVDAHIAKQLYDEAIARAKRAPSVSHKRPRREPSPSPIPQPPREFRSFFEKRYERDTALSRPRRSRRVAMAWGHALPETVDEEEFYLSDSYLDEETMQARERKKRRDRRGKRR